MLARFRPAGGAAFVHVWGVRPLVHGADVLHAEAVLFAEALQLHRERGDLTQTELARRVGVRQQTVSRWESGVGLPPPRRVVVVEDELGLERGTLLRLIGYLPEEERSRSPGSIQELLQLLPDLSDIELLLVIDTAWEHYRERTGLAMEELGPQPDKESV